MPNWQGRQTSRGGGALGTDALGVNKNEKNSRTLKQALYDYLHDSNTNKLHAAGTPAGEWDRMGSSVVVHTMLGESFDDPGRDKSRTISSSDWTTLKARLVDNDAIQMSRQDYDGTVNTSGIMVGPGFNTFDAARYTYDPGMIGPVDSWVFKDGGGKIVYVLEIICANPLGALGGLPDYVPYNLSPSASVNKSVIEPDESVSVTNTVRNGSSSQSDETDWRLTEIDYKPGTDLSAADMKGRDSNSDPCGTFTSGPGRSSCQTVQRSQKEIFSGSSSKTYNPTYTYTAPVNTSVGTKICFTASVSRPNRDPLPVWRHSDLQCVVVGKKPKMQVWGGDVRVGDAIDTSTSTFSSLGQTYGSWGEYAALSNKSNSGFASGAALNKGNKDSAQAGWSDLTFANSGGGASCLFGCYGFSSYAPSLTGQFTSSASASLLSGSRSLSGLGSGTYRAGNVTITGGTIGAGKTVVIVATGTVTITGDITYSDGPYTNIADIPQVVIRASAINIAGSVGNVDAWLIATTPGGTGAINTCSDVAPNAQLTAAICSNTLRVNGPVMTDKLYLRRTAGASGGASALDDPAETFNLRADAYLWGSGYGTGTGKVQTVYTKELPPRF
jgi:hypothetical protein